MTGRKRLEAGLAALVAAALAASAIAPYDGPTWLMEVAPVLIALPLIAYWHRRFPLSDLLLVAVAVHCLVLIAGGHWTYARVPAGDWLRDALGLARNPYDRLGHFLQGCVPALVAREILLRLMVLRRPGFLPFLVLCICLAVSAAYELIEWASAVAFGGGAVEFLGTQGDPWDAQWDMFTAGLGAAFALAFLSRAHDRALARLQRQLPETD